MTKLLTGDQAVAFLHERGLVDLDAKWMRNQMDRGRIPCTIVARRRRVRQDYLQVMIDNWIREAS